MTKETTIDSILKYIERNIEKNVNQAATQYYPSPQITVYLQKTLDDDAAAGVVSEAA